MDILGIGPLELLFILLIALIVLGPQDMVKAGRTLGRVLRKIVTSPGWRVVQQTSRDIRTLPNRLIREAGMEEMRNSLPTAKDIGIDEIKKQTQIDPGLTAWTTPPAGEAKESDAPTIGTPEQTPEQTIAPPNTQATNPAAEADSKSESTTEHKPDSPSGEPAASQ